MNDLSVEILNMKKQIKDLAARVLVFERQSHDQTSTDEQAGIAERLQFAGGTYFINANGYASLSTVESSIGATATFTAGGGETVTVKHGIITSIV